MIFVEFDRMYTNAEMSSIKDRASPWLFMYAVLRGRVPKEFVRTISYLDLDEMAEHNRYVAMDDSLNFVGIAYVDESQRKRRLRTVVDGLICEQPIRRRDYQVWEIYTYQNHSSMMNRLGLDTPQYKPSLNSDSMSIE
jgi:hypothetical protein